MVSGGTGHGDRREGHRHRRKNYSRKKKIYFTNKSIFDNIGANRHSIKAKLTWLESGSWKISKWQGEGETLDAAGGF